MASPGFLAMRAYHRWRLLGGLLRGRRDRWRGVRVFGYHRIADVDETLSVAPAAFRRQMEIVVQSGATPVSLTRALELIATGAEGRFVAVTFDDGYLDNVEQGGPVLGELGIPATIFLPTAMIDGRAAYFWYEQPPPALGWEAIAQVAREGVFAFESHTITHRWLPELTDAEAEAEFTVSRATIEAHTGQSVTTIAFPGGLYGPREQRLVRAAGYLGGLGTHPGVNETGQDPTALKRTLVYAADSEADFTAKLAGLLDGPARLRDLLYARLGPSSHSPTPPELAAIARESSATSD